MTGHDKRIKKVAFADDALKRAFEKLHEGKHEEQELARALQKAILELRENPFCGIRIPSRQWPREYTQKYGITNLWKHNLPKGWRLVYTVRGDELEIISILIEWFCHKDYEKRFGY